MRSRPLTSLLVALAPALAALAALAACNDPLRVPKQTPVRYGILLLPITGSGAQTAVAPSASFIQSPPLVLPRSTADEDSCVANDTIVNPPLSLPTLLSAGDSVTLQIG